jgi:histidine ammonia-lyase
MDVVLDGNSLSIEQIAAVAREGAVVSVAPEARQRMVASRKVIEQWVADDKAIYGVTTGIGEFARIRISAEQSAELQRRIIYSHSAGTGDPQPEDVVKAAMLLRANTLAKGYSGVRLKLIDTIVDMVNKGVVPYINEKGSLGTSGDLSPLSQFAEVAIGEGRAFYRGELMTGGEAMEKADVAPTDLTYKEGLGLINGSQMMTAGAALLVYDAERLLKNACLASAMALDALRALDRPYFPAVHRVRPFRGQNAVAANLLRLFEGSEIMAHKTGKVQDGYSMRCTPQVLGPSLDTLEYVRSVVSIEVNSAADNPLFFAEDNEYYAAGNFHGQGVGLAVDFLCIALSEVANLAERHINRLMNPVLSGLPCRGQGAQQRAHGRPIHGGGPREREQGALPSGVRRFHQRLGRSGGSREHGADRRAQVHGDPEECAGGARDRDDGRRPGDGVPRRAGPRKGDRCCLPPDPRESPAAGG